jgi:hypothetical protein
MRYLMSGVFLHYAFAKAGCVCFTSEWRTVTEYLFLVDTFRAVLGEDVWLSRRPFAHGPKYGMCKCPLLFEISILNGY